jgi:hypothetical protein
MTKTAAEMTNDILKSLQKENAPERILLEPYLEKCLEMARKEARKEVLNFVQPHNVDVNGDIINCSYHKLFEMLNK